MISAVENNKEVILLISLHTSVLWLKQKQIAVKETAGAKSLIPSMCSISDVLIAASGSRFVGVSSETFEGARSSAGGPPRPRSVRGRTSSWCAS